MKKYKDKNWLYQKYWLEELSTVKISKLCGVNAPKIIGYMKKFGIKRRTMKEAMNIEDRPYKHKSWLYKKYWKEGLSSIKIAKICNVGKKAILKWMKKHNIKARNHSEALKGKYQGKDHHMYGKKGKLHNNWGMKLSKEAREKISKAQIGNKKRLGKKHSQKTRELISQKCRGRKQSRREIENRAKSLRGRKLPPFSKEWKDKISKSVTKLWQNPEYVKKMMKSQHRKPSKLEIQFNSITPDIVKYIGNRAWWRKLSDGRYHNPDFKIIGQRKIVEVFGDYWHKNDDPQKLINLYKQIGYDCMIFWEHEIYDYPEIVTIKVNNFIDN